MLVKIRNELYEHIQTLSFSFFDSRPTGKILARIIGDVNSFTKEPQCSESSSSKVSSVSSSAEKLWITRIPDTSSWIMYYVGVKMLGAQAAPVGTLMAFGTYISMFWNPIMNLSNFYNQLIADNHQRQRAHRRQRELPVFYSHNRLST